jgi:hypothetical protein
MRSDYEYGLGTTGLSHEATELVLYAQNTAGVYRAYIVPMLQACQKHYDNGNGDYERVLKGFTRIFSPIAKEYVLEHCGMTDSVRSIFPPSVRRECAEYMAEYFLGEYHLNGGGW